MQKQIAQQDFLPLWHMAKKMVMGVTEKNIIAKLQLGYMYFPALKGKSGGVCGNIFLWRNAKVC